MELCDVYNACHNTVSNRSRLLDAIKILNLQFLLSQDFSFRITSISVTLLMKGKCYVLRYRFRNLKYWNYEKPIFLLSWLFPGRFLGILKWRLKNSRVTGRKKIWLLVVLSDHLLIQQCGEPIQHIIISSATFRIRLMQKLCLKHALKRQNLSGLFLGGVYFFQSALKFVVLPLFWCMQNDLEFGGRRYFCTVYSVIWFDVNDSSSKREIRRIKFSRLSVLGSLPSMSETFGNAAFIYFSDRNQHAIPLFSDAGILRRQFSYYELTANLMFDIRHRNAPRNIWDLFQDISNIHPYNTRTSASHNFYTQSSRLSL